MRRHHRIIRWGLAMNSQRISSILTLCGLGIVIVACERQQPTAEEPSAAETGPVVETTVAWVDAERIINSDSEPQNWLAHGRTWSEQRYSPLDQINDGNVSELGFAWHFDLDTARGQQATPIVVDGVMYTTSAWSKVQVLDAKTGQLKWQFDPEVPKEWDANACCGVQNRGAAVWKGRVYVGTLDGRLIALDAETGDVVWEVQTTDRNQRYSITGAPRVVKDKVVIGNGGAEYGVRGYVTAYDTETGEQAWRFYTVPGNPANGFENDAMEMAAETWTGEWWALGGGGTAWDSFAYDPELNLLYIGTGNGSPWPRALRSPDGGDNLFLCSIVAVAADTGEYVWHYQTVPGDTCAEEWFLLCHRPCDWRADFSQQLHADELGNAHRYRNRSTGGSAGRAIRRNGNREKDRAGPRRRTQLDADVVQSRYRPGLHSGQADSQ